MKVFGLGILCIFLMSTFGFGVVQAMPAVSLPLKTPALDYARIQAKAAEYQQCAEKIETRRAVVFGTAGALGVAVGIYFLHQWVTKKESAAGVVDAGSAGTSADHEAVRNLKNKLQLEQLEKGWLRLILEHRRDVLTDIFLTALLAHPINRLFGSIADKGKALLWFDGEAKVANAEQVFLRDARFFYQSFLSFIKKPAVEDQQAVGFAQRLADQVKRGVGADFIALCYTLEDCFALLLACVTQADAISDDDKQSLEQDVWATCDLFNQAAQEIAAITASDAVDFNEAFVGAFAVHLQKLFGECERLMHAVGTHLFGQRFAL